MAVFSKKLIRRFYGYQLLIKKDVYKTLRIVYYKIHFSTSNHSHIFLNMSISFLYLTRISILTASAQLRLCFYQLALISHHLPHSYYLYLYDSFRLSNTFRRFFFEPKKPNKFYSASYWTSISREYSLIDTQTTETKDNFNNCNSL